MKLLLCVLLGAVLLLVVQDHRLSQSMQDSNPDPETIYVPRP